MDLSGYSNDQIEYHTYLLIDAELVKGSAKWMRDKLMDASIFCLTSEGHGFLDAARNQTVWKKAMGKVKESGGVVAFDVLKALLIAYGKDLVGLP